MFLQENRFSLLDPFVWPIISVQFSDDAFVISGKRATRPMLI